MHRQNREPSEETKQKISRSMKFYHANRPQGEKERTSELISKGLREYWKTIPPKNGKTP